MLFTLAGLTILRVEGDRCATVDAEVVWRHHEVSILSAKPGAAAPFILVHGVKSADGVMTDFSFGNAERVRCRFTVATDGRSVESWTDGISDRDLFALFGEHILRTILVRRDLWSFHAAGLTDGERAILIMGDKGMGKSTLSAALQQRGWSSITDDLARVENVGGRWHTFAGLRPTKLRLDSIAALGLSEGALPPRWDDANQNEDAVEDKRLLEPGELPFDEEAFRLGALIVLRPRGRDSADLSVRIAPPHRAVQALIAYSTDDPLHRIAPPSLSFQRAIGGLVQALPVIEATLPDRMDALHASAEEIGAIAKRAYASRAA